MHRTKINTIFFDWGGVIANDPGDDFLMQLLLDIGASEAQATEIFTTTMQDFMRGKLSEQEYWDIVKNRYGLQVHDKISDEFTKWRGLTVNPDILAFVDKAKNNGIKVAILSNVIEPTYNAILNAGYYDRFDDVIASCKIGFAKPDIEIYQIALEKLNTTAEQAVFIDDKQSSLDPATKMGFITILAQNPQQIIESLSQYIF
jgi:epoxide hydrolase-like predicted phosphatase